MVIEKSQIANIDYGLSHEYLQTAVNDTYAMSTLSGCNTRKYHGLLVTGQPQIDNDQHVMLSTLLEKIHLKGKLFEINTQQYPGTISPAGYQYLEKIEINECITFHYNINGLIFKKDQILTKEGQLLIRYQNLGQTKVNLEISPFLNFRNKHFVVKANDKVDQRCDKLPGGAAFRMYPEYQNLNIQSSKGTYHHDPLWYYQVQYLKEMERGYEFQEDLWVPGHFNCTLNAEESLVLSASTGVLTPELLEEKFSTAFKKQKKLSSTWQILQHAAKQFIVDTTEGTEIIAGFPWFGRWGRDTFIALPGLTLGVNDTKHCKKILDTMCKELDGPLFPNLGKGEALALNSVDAPLWFFWAIQKYVEATNSGDKAWKTYGPAMKMIIEGFAAGTHFNIGMRPDGLIEAGQDGYALTWMDAKFGEDIITPRIGIPVEINALWFNAICFACEMAGIAKDLTFLKRWKPRIKQIKTSFIEAFWEADRGYLADVITDDYKDWSLRPNQVFATSLPYSPLNLAQKKKILFEIETYLLTPKGLRTLNPKDVHYIGVYHGNQQKRDRAYHQGTVWPWLLGHFCEAYLEVHKERGIPLVQKAYEGLIENLDDHCVGSISEIFDGDEPHYARGAVAQAWSVAECIRIRNMLKK